MKERNEIQGHFINLDERWYLIADGTERSGEIMRILGSIIKRTCRWIWP